MRHRSDQLAKNLLRDALSRAASAETEVEVMAETQRIDVYSVPDPARAAERSQMGLLGELAAEPSLFEAFRNTPGLREVRRCVTKQHVWHGELERRARAAGGSPGDPSPVNVPFPALVVIGPGRPETALAAYGCSAARPGVHHAVWGLQMRVLVLAELPRTRETLLLRLLGSGRLLREALDDFAALPADAWERSVATPILVHFRLASQVPDEDEDEEDEMGAEITAWFEDWQRRMKTEVRVEDAARSVLTAFRVRGIDVPQDVRARILAEKDPEILERWHEKAIVAGSVAEVLGEPS